MLSSSPAPRFAEEVLMQARLHRYSLPLSIALITACCFVCRVDGQSALAIVSAANNQTTVAPNSLATIYGTNLASLVANAQLGASGLPTVLGGVSVSIDGVVAPLLYVSPQQINFLVPANTPLGTAQVNISAGNAQAGVSGSVQVALVSLGLFTLPCLRPTRAAAQNAMTYSLEPFQALTSQNAIPDKRTRLSFFGTGLRYAGNAALDPGIVNVASALSAQATDSLGVTHPLTVEYAGPAPDYSGLDQVNVIVPGDLEGAGLVNVQLSAGNATSNSVSIVMSPSLAAGLGSGQTFNIMTAAGSGVAGDAGDGGSAVRAAFDGPSGLALDSAHHLYIASSPDHVVRMVSAAGVITAFAGTGVSGSSGDGGPANQAELRSPSSVAADASGNLYVADPDDNRIRRIAADGTTSTFAGTGVQGFSGDGGLATAAQLWSPSAVTVDPYGAVVIADTGNNRIRRVTSDGIIATVAGNGTAGFSGDGGPAYLAELNGPDSVAVGADGTIYAADERNQRVRRITADGNISTLMSGNLTPLTFESPIRLAVDANQQLFVSDSSSAGIQAMGAACQLNSVAGTGVAGFSGDGGPAMQAQVNGPSALAPDASGDVYFADTNNNRVRRLYQGGCDAPASIFFDPSPAMSGMTVNGTVRLSCPAGQDTALALSANENGMDLPDSVNIAASQTSGTFSFTAPSVSMATSVQVTAANPQISAAGTLLAEPAGGSASGALSMSVAPRAQTGGGPVTGAIAMATPAGSGGATVSLASNNPAAQVRGDAVVPPGRLRAEFAVMTSPVTQPATATITGNADGTSASTALSLLPGSGSLSSNPTGSNPSGSNPAGSNSGGTSPGGSNSGGSGPSSNLAAIASFAISPSSVTAGQQATGSLTLAGPAPAGGALVALSSNNQAASVPASLTIPAGQSSATFTINTSTVSSPATATITASSANATSASLTVNPAASADCVGSISLSKSEVIGGNSVGGNVALTSPAPAGGQPVSLSSSSASASVPSQVTVPAGQSSTGFTVSTTPVLSTATPVISANTGACAGANTALTILPVSLP
jgi:trimeric autotransporter adhesin